MKTARKVSWFGYAVVVAALHVVGITFLIVSAGNNPGIWGLSILAYTLGLRHAFDVDHIAAIDNTVRKLVQQKRNPLGVGFYFSLGHSSVVFLMTIAAALSVRWAEKEMPRFEEIGGLIGTFVSGFFLIFIGIINLVILVQLLRIFQNYRKGRPQPDEFERLMLSRGAFSRILAPMYRFISRSWHVYPLGFLFGLGFDTASEITLLAISAGAAKDTLSITGILSLPILFAAGMSLMDTADGIFMTRAYGWAFSKPIRKLYYNVSVTAIAVVAALLIGAVELAQVLSDKLGLEGGVWNWIRELDFGTLGYFMVVLFLLAWGVSVVVWKRLRLEERWGSMDA